MPGSATRRRARTTLAVLLVGATALGPSMVAGGDGVTDARVEARRIADELDRLQMRESVLGEDFDQAQLALSQLGQRVTADKQLVAQTRHEVARRRNQLSRYAVGAYAAGNAEPLQIVLHSDGNDLGRRLTYESVTAGNQADLIDAFETATSDQAAAVDHLGRAQDAAAKASNDLDQKRKAVTALVAEQQTILSRVQGRLKALVARAEAERAAATAAAVHAAAVRAAAQARAAAPPAPPRQSIRPSHPHRTVKRTIRRVLAPPVTAQRQPVSPVSTVAPAVTTTLVPAPTTPPTTLAPPVTTPAPSVPALPPPTTVPTADPVRPPASGNSVIKWAETRLGSPYVWGAAGPNAFDCSGLVLWSFAQAGRGSLPHSSRAMYAMSLHIPLSALQPGDLVFFGDPVHHVGIYIGGGTMIDALNSRTPVAFHSIYGISETPLAGRI